MPKARANIVASVLKKGFVLHKKKRDHDFLFLRHHERIQPVYAKISRGTKYRDCPMKNPESGVCCCSCVSGRLASEPRDVID